MRWLRLEIVVDAFAAKVATTTYRHAPGAPVASAVHVDWFVSELQMSLAQPGGWVAVLVDPADATQVWLDGFATADGTFVPAT